MLRSTITRSIIFGFIFSVASTHLIAHDVPNKKTVRYKWTYDAKGDMTTCKNQEEKVGRPHDCKIDGTCGARRLIEGLCLARYGKGHIEVDLERTIKRDDWTYRQYGDDSHFVHCQVNGKDIGKRFSCHEYSVCHKSQAIVGLCAALHGHEI